MDKNETQSVAMDGELFKVVDGAAYAEDLKKRSSYSYVIAADRRAMEEQDRYADMYRNADGEPDYPEGKAPAQLPSRKFACVPENIALHSKTPAGRDAYQYVAKGGYLDITDMNDVKGITKDGFRDAYRILFSGTTMEIPDSEDVPIEEILGEKGTAHACTLRPSDIVKQMMAERDAEQGTQDLFCRPGL